MNKTVLTTIEDVKKALNDSKYSTVFTITSTEASLSDRRCFVVLINEKEKATAHNACFQIGFERRDFRFSSNASFENCEFLKDKQVNSKHRFEITVKKDDIVNVINQACADYCKRHKIEVKTTAKKKTTAKIKTA